MGVIDLDARVKKLESGESGGVDPTVIDQLEVAVTALEETVSSISEDLSSEFTPNSQLTFADDNPIVNMWRIENTVFLNVQASITAGASASGSDTIIGNVSSDYRPTYSVSMFALGGGGSSSQCTIGNDGDVKSTGGNWTRFTLFWKIATT